MDKINGVDTMPTDIHVKEKTIIKLQRPKLYRVVLNNDDYTTMEFVVDVLATIFHKTPTEATKIMMDVHQKGKGIVGVYSYDIALTKTLQVEEMAEKEGFPLKTTIEEE